MGPKSLEDSEYERLRFIEEGEPDDEILEMNPKEPVIELVPKSDVSKAFGEGIVLGMGLAVVAAFVGVVIASITIVH